MKRFVALLVVVLCVFALPIKANKVDVDFSALQGLGNPDYHQVKSLDGKRSYHIFVRSVKKQADKNRYPTVYMLDGGVTFPLLSGLYHYMRYTDEIPKMNLVGISYGADSFKNGNFRASDYTAKSKEREYWGGAEEFTKLFSKRIIPLVEQNYAADKDKRILFGQSLGGQFVLYTAMHKTELFSGYIASNPALHRNLDFFIAGIKLNERKNKPKLYVGIGSNDHPIYKVPASKWLEQIRKHPEDKLMWHFKTEILPEQTHVSAAPEAFRRATAWLLKE